MSLAITDAFLASYAEVRPDSCLDVIAGHATGYSRGLGELLSCVAVVLTSDDGTSLHTFEQRTSLILPSGYRTDGIAKIQEGHRFFVCPVWFQVTEHGAHVVRVELGPSAIELPLEVTP